MWELLALFSPNIIWVIKPRLRWVGHVACMEEKRGAYRAFGGKHERKRPLERRSHRWEDNMKMYLEEIGWRGNGLD
jgi:hypothetical protein